MFLDFFAGTFIITLLFILISTVVAVFLRRIAKDKCLKSFRNDFVTLEDTEGNTFRGTFMLESTGMEIAYLKQNEYGETSCLLYKNEYGRIRMLSRYLDEMSEKNRKDRDRELDMTYHPGFVFRVRRKIQNFFKTIRDSIMEIVNTLITQAKSIPGTGDILKSQDRYVARIKQDIAGGFDASYEPLLEKHIGDIVVAEILDGSGKHKYRGILREYTSEFIELMDVDCLQNGEMTRKADVVMPRKLGVVRYHGE